jgi:hypothetical protein
MGLICSIQSGKLGGVSAVTVGSCGFDDMPIKLQDAIPNMSVKVSRNRMKVFIIMLGLYVILK